MAGAERSFSGKGFLPPPARRPVEKMISDYPLLGLRLHEGAKFRVLYGEFASPDAAKEAARGLPDTLLQATGAPLLKASNDPDGETISWSEQ